MKKQVFIYKHTKHNIRTDIGEIQITEVVKNICFICIIIFIHILYALVDIPMYVKRVLRENESQMERDKTSAEVTSVAV